MENLRHMAACLPEHLEMLQQENKQQELEEASMTSIFTASVYEYMQAVAKNGQRPFPQYGLLGGATDLLDDDKTLGKAFVASSPDDPRLFTNTTTPFSAFICGSQGSGKSHTLSCLLENCLIPSKSNKLSNPLAAVVFHFDTFISDHGGSPCEAAFLSSHPAIAVRVLCSPTNTETIRRTYSNLNVEVVPLRIKESDLNTKRMLNLMAVKQDDGTTPLYIHTVNRILREMRMLQQASGIPFQYADFKARIACAGLTPTQLAPLNQRLETLESFLAQESSIKKVQKGKKKSGDIGTNWYPKAGELTILDLSCPCITAETACSMFNTCLSIFLEQDMTTGRVVALDEAHKYMNSSAEATAFTETLLSTIRLQRHLGVRVVVSTQEPTISPKLLDLSSIVIVHRFTSPQWMQSLRQHVAPIDSERADSELPSSEAISKCDRGARRMCSSGDVRKIFGDIVRLGVGEALVFSPNAMIGYSKNASGMKAIDRLGLDYVKLKVRARETTDGGRSVLAN